MQPSLAPLSPWQDSRHDAGPLTPTFYSAHRVAMGGGMQTVGLKENGGFENSQAGALVDVNSGAALTFVVSDGTFRVAALILISSASFGDPERQKVEAYLRASYGL